MKAWERDQAFMRAELARNAGIFIADKPVEAATAPLPADAPVDRDEIRAVLVILGAPARHLDWLTASCPSMELALTYKPSEET